jgi:O-acetyl-ADP-ribose deacetylase (regulator of RNase III)
MIELVRGDITTLEVDAIVNAANATLRGGGGVDGAIHEAAGPELLEELQQWSHCPAGSAVLTGGHRLPARYIIHAVGPVWRGGDRDEAGVLRAAYDSAFSLAREHEDIRSIAFPAISTGVYNFPKPEAARIAVTVMREHEEHFDRIIACVFDEDNAAAYRGAMESEGAEK